MEYDVSWNPLVAASVKLGWNTASAQRKHLGTRVKWTRVKLFLCDITNNLAHFGELCVVIETM